MISVIILQYAELKPVPCLTYSDAQMLREKCATPILKQVKFTFFVIRFSKARQGYLISSNFRV